MGNINNKTEKGILKNIKEDAPLCKICKKDYRSCENVYAREEESKGGPIKIDGWPYLLYCEYFRRK